MVLTVSVLNEVVGMELAECGFFSFPNYRTLLASGPVFEKKIRDSANSLPTTAQPQFYIAL